MDAHLTSTEQELDIAADDLLAALRMAMPTQDDEPGWFTVEELVENGDLGATATRKRLRALIKAGKVEYKPAVRMSLLGRRYHCNSFRAKTE